MLNSHGGHASSNRTTSHAGLPWWTEDACTFDQHLLYEERTDPVLEAFNVVDLTHWREYQLDRPLTIAPLFTTFYSKCTMNNYE